MILFLLICTGIGAAVAGFCIAWFVYRYISDYYENKRLTAEWNEISRKLELDENEIAISD